MDLADPEWNSNVRYVYVQTIMHLWRFDFEAKGRNYRPNRANVTKGALTELIDFRKVGVPLGAGGFVLNSKLFFVGGEAVKTDTPRLRILPFGGSFDDEEEFKSRYNYEEISTRAYDSIGHLKLPRSALNKRVFVLDQFFDPKSRPIVPSITVLPESQGPKTRPFVIPITKEGRTLIYVIAHTPLFYQHSIPTPTFEVFDPDCNSWEKLPDYCDCVPEDFLAELVFEFYGKVFLITPSMELSFDPETKMWESTSVFEFPCQTMIPDCMINVCGGVYLSCNGKDVRAFKLDPEGNIRSQMLNLFCESRGHCWPSTRSTLCNLGEGYVLYVSTYSYKRNLHFVFVRIHIGILNEQRRKHSLDSDHRSMQNKPFVLPSIIDCIYKKVPYKRVPLLDDKSILHAYVL